MSYDESENTANNVYIDQIQVDSVDFVKRHPKVRKFLREFVRLEAPHWIESSLQALTMSDRVEFLRAKVNHGLFSVLVPVDNAKSGIIEANTQLDRALQQMLQIMACVSISRLTLQSGYNNYYNFISQVKHVTALTGTAGSKAERAFTERTFNTMSVVVPRFKERRFMQHSDVYCTTRDEWISRIMEEVSLPQKMYCRKSIEDKFLGNQKNRKSLEDKTKKPKKNFENIRII